MLINILLLILSIGIYASFGITNLIYILFSTITTYIAARVIDKKRAQCSDALGGIISKRCLYNRK